MHESRLSRRPARLAISALALSCVVGVACKGKDSGGSGASPPSIANFSFYPTSAALLEGGGSVSVTFGVEVADAGADVAGIVMTILDAAGAQVKRYTAPLTNPPGQTSGWLNGSMAMPTTALGSFTIEIQLSDAGGARSNVLTGAFAVVTGNPAPSITSLSPSHAAAGSGPLDLTVTGTGFVASSVVLFNGYYVTTSFVDATALKAVVPAYALTSQGTAYVTVSTPPPGGGTSDSATFTIDAPPPNPVPTLSAISPESVEAGTSAVTLTLTGTGFVPSSTVTYDGYWTSSTYVDATTLRATLSSYQLQNVGTFQLAVINPSPGGGISATLPFRVTRPAIPGVTVVALAANDVVWDPFQQRLYASVPSTSSTNPNTITTIDPFAGSLVGSQFAGSEPGTLALSDDGTFLYAGLGGAPSVQRFALPAVTPDIALSLGRNPTSGPYYARDLQVAPGAPRTVAVAYRTSGYSSANGLVVFDDATPRPTQIASGNSLDSIQWGSTASTLYTATSEYPYDLLVLAVDASGPVVSSDFANVFSGSGYGVVNRIHFDSDAGLLYADEGKAIHPATGLPDGAFSTTGFYWPIAMIPDSSLDTAFFAGTASTTSWLVLRAYRQSQYYELRSLPLPYVHGPVRRVARFGVDGVALLTPNEIVLVRGAMVLPASTTENPLPAVASLSPATATAGAGNLRLVVTGSGFVPGSVVRWNGSDRATRFVSATQLVAFLPASDLAAVATAAVTVTNPLPGGGTSGEATFTVN